MKINSKRLVGILICLAMVLAVLPMAVFAADTTTVYCAAPSGWTNCNVYWWGAADTNPGWPGEAMTQGSDGLWYYEVPSDATNVIFNNGSAQSADLDMPTDDKVQWNYEAKEWVAYGSDVPEVEAVYYLRGTMNEWGTANVFEKNADGTYSCTMDLAAGSYEYKAGTEDWGWGCPAQGNLNMTLEADDTVTFVLDLNANSLTYTLASGTVVVVDYFLRGSMNEWNADDASKMVDNGDGTYSITLDLVAGTYEYKAGTADWSYSCPGENAILNVVSDCAVTFVLNLNDNTIVASGDGVDSFVSTDYYVAGQEGLCGSDWAVADEANKMTETGSGVYEITYTNVVAGEYQIKVTNGTWDQCWGGDGPEGNYLVVVEVASDVTIIFDKETESISVEITALVADPTIPDATEPEVTEPEVTEPEVTEPEVTEPEATEPEVTEPEATEPEATEPEATEPEATEPEATEPEATEPEATEPEATEPEATEPEATEPEATEPEAPTYGGLSDYRVTGSTDWLGNWDAAHEAGRMTQVGESTYEITFKNVAAGEYQFKVTMGTWENNWGGDGPDGNYMLNVEEAGDVTIIFNSADGSISVKLPTIPETGDSSMTAILVAMLAATAGLVCTVSKKKEF